MQHRSFDLLLARSFPEQFGLSRRSGNGLIKNRLDGWGMHLRVVVGAGSQPKAADLSVGKSKYINRKSLGEGKQSRYPVNPAF